MAEVVNTVVDVINFIVNILVVGILISFLAYVGSVILKYYSMGRWAVKIFIVCVIAVLLIRLAPLIIYILITEGFSIATVLMFGISTLITAVGLIIVHTGIYRTSLGQLINHPRYAIKGTGMILTGMGVMVITLALPLIIVVLK